MNLNKVILAGNLTRSPELRYTPNGTAVANFGMATNRAWTDESGQRQEEVEYHNIVTFGRQAEIAAEYLRKGQLALIEGRLRTTSWESEGRKLFRTQIVADRVQFGPKNRFADDPNGEPLTEPRDEAAVPADGDQSDDIPF
jgi:single-strand DNA-binding protein